MKKVYRFVIIREIRLISVIRDLKECYLNFEPYQLQFINIRDVFGRF